jgi:pyruvate/2-oxoglutarate dehydrogenase complex dihydrolipoamide dehydrogenase (E3) component
MARLEIDVCVIGGGSAGLSVASGTSQLGLKTALIEGGKMGGECLNYGCVPSKALLAAAKAAHNCRPASFAGISGSAPSVAFDSVKRAIDDVIATIAPNDSVERFEGLGVRVLTAHAAFSDSHTVRADGDIVRARRFVIATGSTATIPDIPGLDPDKILTNESIFDLHEKPARLLILGAGAVGLEMALAHRRLGVPVTVVGRSTMLAREEPELVDTLRRILEQEGIELLEDREVVSVDHAPEGVTLHIRSGSPPSALSGSHLLVATGRTPRMAGLGLQAAGIACTAKGIIVDRRLRTSQHHIFALGDVIDGPRYTHAAGYQAGIVVRNLAFHLPAKVDYRALPRVLYTDPELARVGSTEAEARRRHGPKIGVERIALADNDRAIAERRQAGSIKVIVGPGGVVLGASILAPAAGEMVGLWCLVVAQKLTLKAVANLILPYPTMSEAGKAAASQHYRHFVFNPWTRRLVQALRMGLG